MIGPFATPTLRSRSSHGKPPRLLRPTCLPSDALACEDTDLVRSVPGSAKSFDLSIFKLNFLTFQKISEFPSVRLTDGHDKYRDPAFVIFDYAFSTVLFSENTVFYFEREIVETRKMFANVRVTRIIDIIVWRATIGFSCKDWVPYRSLNFNVILSNNSFG